jgi:hexulose-6-phosphate isomerase
MAAAAPAALAQGGTKLPIKKGVIESMITPKSLTMLEKFQIAKDVGFDEIECHTEEDPKRADEIKEASVKTGMHIHSVMNSAHWKFPLNSTDPQVVAASMKGMETSLRNAKLWGAQTVLLVPAVMSAQTSYRDSWTRSQAQIRKLIPMAQEYKVVIAVEDVWNKFLLSPKEFAEYVDEFKSPWVKAYFDVGNIVLYGYPQDWIRTLGKRIDKLHFKDFRFQKRQAEFVPLREGDIDWKEIYKALVEIGYKGTATVEVQGGDKAAIAEISRRVDMILTGA